MTNRIPRKAGQPAKSDKHSDLYTDEDPKDTGNKVPKFNPDNHEDAPL